MKYSQSLSTQMQTKHIHWTFITMPNPTLQWPADVQGTIWPVQNAPGYCEYVQAPHMQMPWPQGCSAHVLQQVSSQSTQELVAGYQDTDESVLVRGMHAPGPVHSSASDR